MASLERVNQYAPTPSSESSKQLDFLRRLEDWEGKLDIFLTYTHTLSLGYTSMNQL